jgi:hypothetical protein
MDPEEDMASLLFTQDEPFGFQELQINQDPLYAIFGQG